MFLGKPEMPYFQYLNVEKASGHLALEIRTSGNIWIFLIRVRKTPI